MGQLKHLVNTLRYYTRKFQSYNLFTYAACASFFIVTAILPLMVITISIVSFTPLAVQDFLDMVFEAIPESFYPVFNRIMDDISGTGITALSVSVVALLWSASKSVLGLMDGLNAIAGVQDFRNYFLKRAICIIYMLLMILGMILTLGLRVFGRQILGNLRLITPHLANAFEVIMNFRGLTLFFVISLIIVIVYTAFPNKKMRMWLQIPGAVFSAFAWIAFSEVYSIYVEHYSSFSILYGTIGVVVLAMVWLYFCISIVFIGAVINQLYPSIFWRAYIGIKYRRIQWRQRKFSRRTARIQRLREKKGIRSEHPAHSGEDEKL